MKNVELEIVCILKANSNFNLPFLEVLYLLMMLWGSFNLGFEKWFEK